MYRDKHHLIFDRVSWSSRPEARALRNEPSLALHLPRPEHELIHSNCPAIPLLGYHGLVRTLKYYEPGDTPFESVSNLMGAIEQSTQHPAVHPIERDLAELAVRALDLERPFILGKGYR